MVWVFAGYGGQLAVRLGDWKLVRQRVLRAPDEGAWELYDLAADPTESHDVAAEHPGVVERAVRLLRRETDENELFPVPIP